MTPNGVLSDMNADVAYTHHSIYLSAKWYPISTSLGQSVLLCHAHQF